MMLHGVRLDPETLDSATALIERWMDQSRRRVVVCWNVNYLLRVRQNPTFSKILNHCHLCLCDGVPLLWLGRLGRLAIPERVAGPDLLLHLLQHAQGRRIFLLGGHPEAAERVRTIVGTPCTVDQHAPSRANLLLPDVNERIRRFRPHLVVVALGEVSVHWAWMVSWAAQCPVFAVGGALDMVTGRVKRAPRWMQVAGLELPYRAWQEPRLWRRIAHDAPRFAWLVAMTAWRRVWYADPGSRRHVGSERT